MEVYIDKANLKSMIASGKHPMFGDTMRMLKKKFDIFLNFSKSDIDKQSDVDIRQWMTAMVDGAGSNNVMYLTEPFPTRPLKSNMHTEFSRKQLSAVFMIDDEKADLIKKKGCFLISQVKEEINVLSHLIIKDSDYSFDKKVKIKSMSSWADFDDHISPCSDIIIIDQYILCDSNIYGSNIYSLIRTLAKYANDSKLNIVIVTKKTIYNKDTGITSSPDWDVIKGEIKRITKIVCGIKANVTFVLSPTDIGEHDRTIFTNYRRVYSGDTFNYFDSSGNIISKGKEVHLCSMAETENYQLGFSLLDDLQVLVNTALGRNNDLILGDKKCNYLKFEQPV